MTLGLFDSITLPCGSVIKNRTLKSAMSEGLGSVDYQPTPELQTLYHAFAMGGCGLVVTGNVMVHRNALGEPGNVVIDENSDQEALKQWADQATQNNTACFVQLNHPGKQSPRFISKQTYAPSAIALSGGYKTAFRTPQAMSLTMIQDTIERFAAAAAKVQQAGFTGVQIHAAHGYLISQFLSPLHNQRDDHYGGSLENRARFLMDILRAIRLAVGPSFPIGVKMNVDDFKEGGFNATESLTVMQWLDEGGIDLIEISGGSYEQPVMTEGREGEPIYFLSFAKKIKETIKAPLVVTGGFRSLESMRLTIEEGHCDFVGIARPFALQPSLINDLQRGQDFPKMVRLTTGFKRLDKKLGAALGLSYYGWQLKRIAQNKPPKITRNAYRVLGHTLYHQGFKALKRRRYPDS